MAADRVIKRLVICVDGTWTHADGTTGYGNNTNVYRIKAVVKEGMVVEADGRQVQQIAEYYHGIGVEKKGLERLAGGITGEGCEEQIKAIIRKCSEVFESPEDELFLFGFSRGAYVVRAVAGFLHHMRLPTLVASEPFDKIYQEALELYRARQKNDKHKCGQIYEYLVSQSRPRPKIKFVGVFDTVKYTNDKALHDISFVDSIHNLRHALALNENRSVMTPEFLEPKQSDGQRSFVQAWFLGAHADMGGASENDGLSLYPLQWMLIESQKCGLAIGFDPEGEFSDIIEDPLKLVFPNTSYLHDAAPNANIWQIRFKNGLEVEMHDLRSTLRLLDGGGQPGRQSHMTVINFGNSHGFNSPRKVFEDNGLRGWELDSPFGTIVHPSVFLEFDLNQRAYGYPRLRRYRGDLGNFRRENLIEGPTIPWMPKSTFLEPGVSAFRILVFGRTGVGKSTLINRVFGVEMTEEQDSLSQGIHNIDKAFSSHEHPGLLIHDSRGYGAGSDEELKLIEKFLKRSTKGNPSEQLHVIWFCLDCDATRIEKADRTLFETVAKHAAEVPIFIVGTKKDKPYSNYFTSILGKRIEQTDPSQYSQAVEACQDEAQKEALDHFQRLQDYVSTIPHYSSDIGFCFVSKDDKASIRELLSKTLTLIDDQRVRIFCVAAQVVDVDQKINTAITECMRLGRHASRTTMVPLPFSGMIGTPTVSRILCEHVLQCFGFRHAKPDSVTDIMQSIVWGNMKQFMIHSLLAFVGVAGLGVGILGCLLASPPTARMLLKCACDMILILEQAFSYGGKYVTETQIENAASRYVSRNVVERGEPKTLQDFVRSDVDRLVPLFKIDVGLRFNSLRAGMAEIIQKYSCRKEEPKATPRSSMFKD